MRHPVHSPDTAPAPVIAGHPSPATWLLPATMLTTLAHQLSGWVPVALASHALLALYLIGQWRALTRVPRIILCIALALMLTMPWFTADPGRTLYDALNRAAWFATFLAALSFLRIAAETSPLVRRCGAVLISQPPGKRYAAISGGAFVIGMLLNMAVLNLLGVMIRRSNTLDAAGGHQAVREARARRMYSAMIRGFATTPLGSPLTLTLALILSIIPDLRWWTVLPWGIVTMLMLLALGWLLDRATAPRHLAGLVARPQPVAGGPRTIGALLALVGAVFAAAVAVELVLDIALPLAILLTAPPAAFVWMLIQRRRLGAARAVLISAARLRRGAPEQFDGMRAEVAILGAAALMGTLIARAVPPDWFATALGMAGLHGPAVAVLVLVLMAALPQLGLNPVLIATILLSALANAESFGLAPELLALATMCGWTLAVGSGPVTSTILIVSRLAGVSTREAGWGWNGHFTALATALCAVWLLLLGHTLFAL